MRVLLLQNLAPEEDLVNGSQGTIVDFEPYDESRLPDKDNGLSGPHAKYCHYQILEFAQKNGCQSWPVVRFDCGRTRTIFADCMASEYGHPPPYSLLSRTQIPLRAGYAMTVHKAQVRRQLDRIGIYSDKFTRA